MILTYNSIPPCYPNPFNSETTVTFNVPLKQFLELSVYNLLGQKISTIFQGEKPPGVYQMHIDGYDMTSGVYFIRMEIGYNSFAKKILLVK